MMHLPAGEYTVIVRSRRWHDRQRTRWKFSTCNKAHPQSGDCIAGKLPNDKVDLIIQSLLNNGSYMNNYSLPWQIPLQFIR